MIDFILTKFQNLRFLGQFPTLFDPYRQRLLTAVKFYVVCLIRVNRTYCGPAIPKPLTEISIFNANTQFTRAKSLVGQTLSKKFR